MWGLTKGSFLNGEKRHRPYILIDEAEEAGQEDEEMEDVEKGEGSAR